MSAASAAAVLGEVDETAGAAGVLAAAFLVGFFLAAARLREADEVVFFFVWEGDSSGAIAIPAISRRAKARILRCDIDLD